MIQTLVAELQVSAPLIMSGHTSLEKGDSLRPSAIKGALRFWWRALQWPQLRESHASDQEALKALHQAEADLFGAAAGESGKQSKVLLRIDAKQRLDMQAFSRGQDLSRTNNQSKSYPGAVYLMGQGHHDKNGCQCAGLLSSAPISMRLSWRANTLEDAERDGLVRAVMALGLLGSVGARARKGFGSLSLQALTLNGQPLPVPTNLVELRHWLAELPRGSTDELPPFTAFGPASRCWMIGLKPAREPLELLNEYGLQMMHYRQTDKQDKQGKVRGLGLFKDDIRQLSKLLENRRIERAPQRAIFGLPSHIRLQKNIEIKPAGKSSDGKAYERRASPLLAHIHRFPSGEQIMLTIMLPAKFLPEDRLIITASREQEISFSPDWSVIEGFIKQCGGEELMR
ncbi:type III-B CRISPR module RAMP protein Cmr1 [Aeromonas dhakensis]|uniref:type III-B CRISPR module RAMP protein Cmr1 n=1 Tax=Aeromonas dhakensis TaxID=196024 RepID=UPI0028920AB3|nr:type III-B CRISPR module RAMP protein Cmr1 [Aeromonas dhakensis]HDX9007857.1 type III-B CRISPR module RAMP protein Cmr1 [Aeromonas dhakensis]